MVTRNRRIANYDGFAKSDGKMDIGYPACLWERTLILTRRT